MDIGFKALGSSFEESSDWGDGKYMDVRALWRNNLGWRPRGRGELGPLPLLGLGRNARGQGFKNRAVVWLQRGFS